ARPMERFVRRVRSFDVELVPGRVVEGESVVSTDLRCDVERAEERERTPRDGRARDVEVDVDAAAPAQVSAAGDVEEAGELSEPVALPLGRDCGELLAKVVREHRGIPRG